MGACHETRILYPCDLGALAAVNFVYQAVKNRGLKGAIFGAPITRTVGELDLGKVLSQAAAG
jgi:hypothetical protein